MKDSLNIDGIPLMWFYKPYLYFGDLPKKNSYIFRKSLLLSELIKCCLSKDHVNSYESNKKRVLFLTYTDHIRSGTFDFLRIDRLLNKIEKDNKIQPFILVCDSLSKIPSFKLRSVSNLVYSFMWDIDYRVSMNKAKKLHELSGTVKMGDPRLKLLFSTEFIFLTYMYYETIKKIIKKYHIRMIFLTGDGSIIERCALAAAHNMKIYSMLNSHGYISPIVTDYQFFNKARIAVFGKEQERIVLNNNYKLNAISQTGALTFDYLTEAKQSNIQRISNILFLTQAAVEKKKLDKETYFNYIRKYFTALNSLSAVKITLKLHPAEKYENEYKAIIKSLPVNNIEISYRNTQRLIKENDVIFSFRSSVILMSMILKKPVICSDLLDKNVSKLYQLERENKSLLVMKKNDDIVKMFKMLNNQDKYNEVIKKQTEYINNYFCALDGKAYERVANYIYEVLHK